MKIEFFGPPGCGKTYLTEQLTGKNREAIRKEATNPFLAKIKYLSRWTPLSLWYNYQLRKLLPTKNLNYKFHNTSITEMLDSIILVASTYKLFPKKRSLLDEGLVQRIISFGVNYELSDEKIINLIEYFCSNLKHVKVVYIALPIEETLSAIKERNRKEAKMDFLDEAQLLEFIQRYKHICERIATVYNFQKITRQEFEQFVEECREK